MPTSRCFGRYAPENGPAVGRPLWAGRGPIADMRGMWCGRRLTAAPNVGQVRRPIAPWPLRHLPASRGSGAAHAVRRDPAPDRPAQAEATPHMTAWCSTPGSAQEKSARRALVEQPRRLGWHICRGRGVAWGSGTALPCRDALLRGLKEFTMAGTNIRGIPDKERNYSAEDDA
jgi:hypothetical protein